LGTKINKKFGLTKYLPDYLQNENNLRFCVNLIIEISKNFGKKIWKIKKNRLSLPSETNVL